MELIVEAIMVTIFWRSPNLPDLNFCVLLMMFIQINANFLHGGGRSYFLGDLDGPDFTKHPGRKFRDGKSIT
jgi:hypothetical protein